MERGCPEESGLGFRVKGEGLALTLTMWGIRGANKQKRVFYFD